jgi:tRNA pseudouridine13 synthase
MFNFAFQSFLWNEYLREYIEEKYLFKRIRFINDWKLSFFLDVYDPDYLSQLEIPFTAHEHHPQDYLLRKVISKVQRRYGIRREWFDKEVAGIKVMTDGLRKAVVSPQNFKIVEKTKEKITVKFYLPAGSYATILLRFLLKV